MFTKQHYKAIAEIVKQAKIGETFVDVYDPAQVMGANCVDATCEEIGNKLADYFAKNNPRFDREKFLEACGL